MSFPRPFRFLAVSLTGVSFWIFLSIAAELRGQAKQSPEKPRQDPVDFIRSVQPLLSAKCFACHGPDEQAREGDLRLDLREPAIKSGAITPGNPDSSSLVERIFADGDEQMPPADSGKALTAEEKRILRDWIAQGAEYRQHWAFVPPSKPPVPGEDSFPPRWKNWSRNPIDRFVLKTLLTMGLTPSPQADRLTLIRRLYLDLIGLPPTPEQADRFANNQDPRAYEQLVDELLQSSSFGEKWGRHWLDLARYADTNGYEKDRPRTIWPYRDWVIRAINDDLPFDRFTIEQLAGDMLPSSGNPAIDNARRIATGFHRNTMLNEEGGIDPLEYRFYAMVDRVATTGTVWFGLTLGCAQCHSHKYDPISQTDYYRLMAFLNNADEPDLEVLDPAVQQRRREIQARIEHQEMRLPEILIRKLAKSTNTDPDPRQLNQELEQWIVNRRKDTTRWRVIEPTDLKTNLPKLEIQADKSIFATGDFTKRDVYDLRFDLDRKVASIRLEVLPDPRLPAGGPGNAYYEGRKGDFFLSEFQAVADGGRVEFSAASTTYGKISIGNGTADGKNVYDGEGSTGWSTSGREGQRNVLVLNLKQPVHAKQLDIRMIFERHFVASLGRFRISVSDSPDAKANPLPADVEFEIATYEPSNQPSAELKKVFLLQHPALKTETAEIDRLRRTLPQSPMTMVFRERTPDHPRLTYRHHRGEYLQKREQLSPGIPPLFSGLPKDTKMDRLNFARWLVSDANPLAGRVEVNRTWQYLFGTGLVETAGDFGTQGAVPTHPQLLDWLAVEFKEQGWSRKKLIRMIVTSSTYRQTSQGDPESFVKDPRNQWLQRGSRYRVDAEVVRDILLAASGKLSRKMYGPSVFPPQPASVTALAYGNTRWNVSTGEDRYRRSLYTFSKRTAPFAAYQTFNAPTGENCVPRRDRSNTPLQALTLLNDEMFRELAIALADLAVEKKLNHEKAIAEFMFRRLLTRRPTPDELERILRFHQAQSERLKAGELDAKKISGPHATNESASWTLVARALMSLDEVITRQ